MFCSGSGRFCPRFPPVPLVQSQLAAHRFFVWDGLLLALLVYAVVLALEAARKRLRGPGGLTTLALVLALVLGLAMKFGFKGA